MTRFLIALSFWLSLIITISAQTASRSDICFLPNGDAFDNGDISSSHKPCTSIGLPTICCALNRQNPPGGNSRLGVTRDECLPNGLCQNRMVANGVETITFWANYCTDRDFDGGNCLNICKQSRNEMGYTAMTSCNGRADSSRWCCGANNSACCTTGVGLITLPQNFTTKVVANTTATIPGIKVSTSSFTTPSTSPSGPSSPVPSSVGDSQPSGGAIAGIVVGTLIGVAILSAIIFLGLCRRSKRKIEAGNYQKGDVIAPYYLSMQGGHYYGELNSQNEKYELPQSAIQELQQLPYELPGQSGREIQLQPDIRIVSPHGSSALIQPQRVF